MSSSTHRKSLICTTFSKQLRNNDVTSNFSLPNTQLKTPLLNYFTEVFGTSLHSSLIEPNS